VAPFAGAVVSSVSSAGGAGSVVVSGVVVVVVVSSPQPATTNAEQTTSIANKLLIARSPEMNGEQNPRTRLPGEPTKYGLTSGQRLVAPVHDVLQEQCQQIVRPVAAIIGILLGQHVANLVFLTVNSTPLVARIPVNPGHLRKG
jgi:hypothetical protein